MNILRKFFSGKPTEFSLYGFSKINQVKKGEDGFTCVAMLLKHFGDKIEMKEFRKIHTDYLQLSNIEAIANFCTINKVKTSVFTGHYSQLKEKKLPCIIYWRMRGFAILVHIDGEKYTVFDPGNAQVEYRADEFECYYCEQALLISK